jgi:hypothetical protein
MSHDGYTFGTNLANRGKVIHRFWAAVTYNRSFDFLLLAGVALLAGVPAARWRLRIPLLAGALFSAAVARYHAWDTAQPHAAQFYINSAVASTPLLFLGLCPIWRKDGRMAPARADLFIPATGALSMFLSTATSPFISTIGFNMGPRVLLAAYPSLVLFALAAAQEMFMPGDGAGRLAAERRPRNAAGALVAIVIALGFADSLVVLHRVRLKANLGREVAEFVRSTGSAPILTNMERMGTELAQLFYTRPILGFARPEQRESALGVARQLDPNSAVLLIPPGTAVPPMFANAGTVTPIRLDGRVRFPDGMFSMDAYRVRWDRTAPDDVATTGTAGQPGQLTPASATP